MTMTRSRPAAQVVSPSSLHRRVIDSPVGGLTIVTSPTGVRAVLWPDDRPGRVPSADPDAGAGAATDDVAAAGMADLVASQLEEYFAGERRTFDVPLDVRGTVFQLAAWRALTTIPYGETATYAQQAGRIGDARKARAVGAANGRNPVSIVVPCHRVIGADGSLTGFAGGVDTKAWLLAHEARHR